MTEGAVLFIKQTLTEYFGMRFQTGAASLALVFLAGSCGTRPVVEPEAHLQKETPASRTTAALIPQPVQAVPMPPPPEAGEAEIRYSVVVANQPVRDVLFAMARETKVNFDIHPGIEGSVNLNAIKQTLNRIARQVDMRWEMEGQTITVMPDTPFLRNYRVDYVNLARDVSETIGIATQVISGAVSACGTAAGPANNSTLTITSFGRQRFWETLERNIKDLLRETDKVIPTDAGAAARRPPPPAAAATPGRAAAEAAAL